MHSGTQRDKLGSPQYADNDDSSSGCSFVSLTLLLTLTIALGPSDSSLSLTVKTDSA